MSHFTAGPHLQHTVRPDCAEQNVARQKKYQRRAGFTLLEMMVVLILIGVIVGTVTLSVGDGGRRDKLQFEAERLQATMKLALEEAQLQGMEMGLVTENDQYRFVGFKDNLWGPIADDKAYSNHKLPKGFELNLKVEGFDVADTQMPGVESDKDNFGGTHEEKKKTSKDGDQDPDAEANTLPGQSEQARREKAKKNAAHYTPQLYLLSSGEVSPFVLAVGSQIDPGVFYRLRGLHSGDIAIEGPIDGNLYGDIDKAWIDPREVIKHERR